MTGDKRALVPDKHKGSGRKAAVYSNSDQTMSVIIGIDRERYYQVAPVKIVDDFSSVVGAKYRLCLKV